MGKDSIIQQNRTPRDYNWNQWVVKFKTKNKKLFYEVLHWNDEGTNIALITKGEYHGVDPESLIPVTIDGDLE
jgi:hypothetical protein